MSKDAPSLVAHDTSVVIIHALSIAEVLELILDALANDKRTISHLAFTCKTVAEPALDRLWALNESLEPFISLLPKELVLDDNSFFRFDHDVIANLPLEKWAAFDNYARRARRLYAKTVTMNPHRVYSSIYKQLTGIRPDVELFPNLISLALHARRVPNPNLRMFPSNLRHITFSWANIKEPHIETVLWSSLMNRLLLDAPLLEHIRFEGSPKEPLHILIPFSFRHLQKITIKANPLLPNVLHKYSHALSASTIKELDLRLVRWPDPRLQPMSPVFPSLRKLTFDGSPTHAVEFVQLLSSHVLQEVVIASQSERSGNALGQYAQFLVLLADKYRGVLKALKIQHPLLCHDEANLELFLAAARSLANAGIDTFQLNLIVSLQNITQEVQDVTDPLKWSTLKHFKISFRRASISWSWVAQGNPLIG